MILGGDDAVVAECSAEEVGIRARACNLQFIAESFTVLHTTGKTPRELAERVEQLEAALREASHWIPDGSGMSPAKRGANLETKTDLVRLIDSLLARNGTE